MTSIIMLVACLSKPPTTEQNKTVCTEISDTGATTADDSGIAIDSGDSGTDTAITADTALDSGYDPGVYIEHTCAGDKPYTFVFQVTVEPVDQVLIVGHYSAGYQQYRAEQGPDIALTSDWDSVAVEFDKEGYPTVLCNWWGDDPDYPFYVMDQFVLTVQP